jgi:hypothetical protein
VKPWEYKVEEFYVGPEPELEAEEFQEILNKQGSMGWELVDARWAGNEVQCAFKRQKRQIEKPLW